MRQRSGRTVLVERAPAQAVEQAPAALPVVKARVRWLPSLWLFAALAALLFSTQAHLDPSDIGEYQCYALVFWHGAHAAAALPKGQCLFPLASFSPSPFHELPREYGPLAMLVFLPPILAPVGWYLPLFTAEMLIVILALTWILHRAGPYGAGHTLLVYLLLGSMLTATGRFDIVPGACCLLALLAMRANRQGWAYAALAIGVLLKYFPALLLPLLLIETWRRRDPAAGPFAWRVWRGPAIFGGVVALGEGIAFALQPTSVLKPILFGLGRCTEIESSPSTLAFLWAQITGTPTQLIFSSNTTCIVAPGTGVLGTLCLLVALVGMAYTLWLFWRGRLSLALAASLLLCLAMLGSKVFSPQYLLWVSPLVAWEFGLDGAALVAWGGVCIITTLCYPLSYDSLLLVWSNIPADIAVPVTALLRNALLAALVVVLLRRASTRRGRQWTPPPIAALVSSTGLGR